ncbi:MAG: glycoside hydrolase family 2 protein [Akkermansiaceae bacterium]|nr:glycoside hydrolase family 2 protein [Verrucomicrobiales bacterium]
MKSEIITLVCSFREACLSRLNLLRRLVCALALLTLCLGGVLPAGAQTERADLNRRERLLMDFGWRFAFGHPTDPKQDFGTGLGYFSYLTKTGYGDGAAGRDFDDRAWRQLDLPHDWAVEAPFDGRGSHSHGYKAVGRNFPERSVGWYRKSFVVPASDLGRRISIEFDGAFRDSQVWVNGHYLGNEPSGYLPFAYNITEFLNYGGTNVIAVRVDATMEEGWFYEGAGIYRHAWLVKTDPLHVQRNGTFVTADVKGSAAEVAVRASIFNEGTNAARFDIEHTILDANGKVIAVESLKRAALEVQESDEFSTRLKVANPALWSIETPHLYKLVTRIRSEGVEVDRYETPFGIRSIRFDPNHGFFLNGKRVTLKGANNHQDHAGVGAAMPDALQDFRIARMKEMGANAYRCSHNPPTPELLDACDRLGMVVIDEHRMMGTSEEQLDDLKRLILRDRNHPSVILWGVGNEEWGIESNVKGARITATMQAVAKRLDPTRRATVAISGGWGGSSTTADVVGYNYISQGNPDKQHAAFPNQPGVGTEETTTQGTRGIYFDDRAKAHLAPLEKGDSGGNCEKGWSYYAARPFLAGIFFWTGFDYRGEPTPFGYPAISCQYGIMDTCGFPKDSFFYLKSWWTDLPVLHLMPHWNWPDKLGQELNVWAYSNCEEVELFLNGQSQGRKTMPVNSHLEWKVKYEPGTLLARGYRAGKEILVSKVETTGAPAAIQFQPDRASIKADKEDSAIVAVETRDAQGRWVPTAARPLVFEISGPGKIIGVGNGDPSSHEPDRFIETVRSVAIEGWRMKALESTNQPSEFTGDLDDSNWQPAFGERRGDRTQTNATLVVYRGGFELPVDSRNATLTLLLRSLGESQSVYLNGKLIAEQKSRAEANHEILLSSEALRAGRNLIAIVAAPARGGRGRADNQTSPAQIRMTIPAGSWSRSLFSGRAQVIVQSTGQAGQIVLTARSPGIKAGEVTIQAGPAVLRAAIP